MKAGKRGTIRRISIDLEYPNGDEYTRVIEGDTLERLALIAFSGQAIRDHLGNLKQGKHAYKLFRDGYESPRRGKPAMMLLFADGSYTMECDWDSHHPGLRR